MSIKHRKGGDSEQKKKETDYTKSNHTKNNYKTFIKSASHQEILSEYQKLTLILQMMKHRGINSIKPYPDKKHNQNNIDIIKYKYNMICQEITKRNYGIMNDRYKNSNVRYKSR